MGTGAHIPGLDYLWALVPLLLCLNWLSYIALSACVPAMMLCAFKAPHLTRHAKALTFLAINVANLLPVGKGVAWNHWPALIESTRLAAAPDIQTMVWWLLVLLLSAWLGRDWLKKALTGRPEALYVQGRIQQHGDRGRDEAETRRRHAHRSGRGAGRLSPARESCLARARRTEYNRRRRTWRASVRDFFHSPDDGLRRVVADKLRGAMEDTRPQFRGADGAYEAFLKASPDWRAY